MWTPDGRIAYSDEPRLIGTRYALGEDEQQALATGDAEAEVADLSKPENRFERDEGSLLEVYLPIRTPGGRQALFELVPARVGGHRERARHAGGDRARADRRAAAAVAHPAPPGLARGRAWRRGRASGSGCWRPRSSRRRWSAGGWRPTSTTAPSRASPACRTRWPRPPQRAPEGTDPATRRRPARGRRVGARGHPAAARRGGRHQPGRLHDEGLAAALDDLAAPLRARGVEVRARTCPPTSHCPRAPSSCCTGRRARRSATWRPTRTPGTWG